jgi:hypothetical protein
MADIESPSDGGVDPAREEADRSGKVLGFPQQEVGKAEVDPDERWNCTNCGNNQWAGYKECKACGQPRDYNPVPVIPPSTDEAKIDATPTATSHCGYCGGSPRLVVWNEANTDCICADCALQVIKLIVNAASEMLKQMPPPVPINDPPPPRIIIPGGR